MIKEVIRQTKHKIGIVPAKNYNRYVYENELKIIRMLLCECTPQFIKYIINCPKEELAELLSKELDEDKQTLFFN